MTQTAKYIEIAEMLHRQIKCGDYAFSALPGAPRLAADTGVSYMTARQAVNKLISDGVVRRTASGRLEVVQESSRQLGSKLKAAFIFPSSIPEYKIWQGAIQSAAKKCECSLQEVLYSHQHDPLLYEALGGDFDLIFFQPLVINSLLLEKLKKNKDRIVTLFSDLTQYGIRCFNGPETESIYLLIKHLYDIGHRRIDCFFGTEEQERAKIWRESLQRLNCTGALHPRYFEGMESPMEENYRSACRIIESGVLKATAIYCTMTSYAPSVIRALYDHGLRVPDDISVVAFGDRALAKMLIPSLTVIAPEKPLDTAVEIFEHYLKIREQPDKLIFRTRGGGQIQYGESTKEINTN